MNTDIQSDLIFDLGMHHALDTGFYLAKGFRVAALEANPAMVAAARSAHADAIARGALAVVDEALWERDDEEISFYLNAEKDDWSSAIKGWAEKGGHASQEIRVRSLTLSTLFDRFGVPRYVKCDIEGADELFVAQLLADRRRPAFVSIEAVSLGALARLHAAGYDRFQLVNQAFSGYVSPPNPPREGRYAEVQFTGHMSGLFGRELEPDRWIGFDEAARRYLDFMALRAADPLLAHGWLDFHAAMPGALG